MCGLQRRALIRAGAMVVVMGGCALGALAGFRSVGVAPGALLDLGRQRVAADGAASPPALKPRAASRTSAGAAAGAMAAASPPTRANDALAPARTAQAGEAGAREAVSVGEGDPEPRGERTPDASPAAIVLDHFQVPPSAVSASAAGFDPAGPRALVLWRVDARRATRLADGYSDADGGLHFPQVAAPGDALSLVVAPVGAPPPSPESSGPASLSRADLLAPVVEDVVPAAGGVVLRIAARETTGSVLVAAADGTLLGRFALSARRAGAPRILDVAVSRPEGSGGLLVAQELPDGRRSGFTPVALPSAEGGGP